MVSLSIYEYYTYPKLPSIVRFEFFDVVVFCFSTLNFMLLPNF